MGSEGDHVGVEEEVAARRRHRRLHHGAGESERWMGHPSGRGPDPEVRCDQQRFQWIHHKYHKGMCSYLIILVCSTYYCDNILILLIL